MRDDFLKAAQLVVDDPYILVNLVSQRVKQFKRGSRPLIESLEKLAPEDIALREIAEGRITYEMAPEEAPGHQMLRSKRAELAHFSNRPDYVVKQAKAV